MLGHINKKLVIKVISLIMGLELLAPSLISFAVDSHTPRDPEFGYFLLGVILIVFIASIWNYIRNKKSFK